MDIKIPLGIEDFAKLREDGFYYVDKTFFIEELLSQQFEVNLVTRPRRFGKTLTMSMFENFFDIARDSKALFDGLKISKDTELCQEWMNQWPVVFISLKSIEGYNFEMAYGQLKVLVSDVCKKYAFLLDSDKVNIADRQLFEELMFQTSDAANLNSCLLLFTRMMNAHYGKQAILLIDEYDVPLAKAHENGYYTEMLGVIRAMLGAALKTNSYLKFAVVTGCLKISKESIFTGINNLVVNTVMVKRFDEGIGFTQLEVSALLAAAGLENHAEEIRKWYDGYRFGSVDVYCPWDVLSHVSTLMTDPTAAPKSYWEGTSSNSVIYKLFENETFDVNSKFEALLAGESIHEVVTENLTYDSLEASEESLWSLLLMTGYLTQTKSDVRGNPSDGIYLKIPNEEVKDIFRKSVVEWFNRSIVTIDRSKIFDSLWSGDTGTAVSAMSDLLFTTISYYDYKEDFYHAFVAGIFAGAGYYVESNKEHGNGRPDVVVKDKRNRRVMLFEVKHVKANETLEHACKAAIEQMQWRRYSEAFTKEGYRTVIGYGIAFKEKDCLIEQCK